MSALENALRHTSNRPGPLVHRLAALVNPSANLWGLADSGGSFCDFRPGQEEENPSLSASMGNQGAVFHRFGGDGFEGGAVAFVESCLSVPKREAVRLLIEWAGVVDTAPVSRPKPELKAKAGTTKLLDKVAKYRPLEASDQARRLRGWQTLHTGSSGPEIEEVNRRGLLPAISAGLLTAYRLTRASEPKSGSHKTVWSSPHILPGALAFEVRGPDGKAWAIKVRNPGSKAALAAAKKLRYIYLGKGQSTPAWCSAGTQGAVAHLIVEGELNGAACALMLNAAGYGAVSVQGVASAGALPHVSHIQPGHEVWIYADADIPGNEARRTWAGLLHQLGAKVHILPAPSTFASVPADQMESANDADACGWLSAGVAQASTQEDQLAHLGEKLMKEMQVAPIWTPPDTEQREAVSMQERHGDIWLSKREGYGLRSGRLCALSRRKNDEGEDYESAEVLAEFAAYITAEVTQEDGTGEAPRIFEVQGTRPDGKPLNPARVSVTAAEFPTMNWPVSKWGAAGIVHAGQGKKDKARAAIQLLSQGRGVTERTVYQHTGWIQHQNHGPLYLTAGAVIGKTGAVDGVDVELSGRLAAYALPAPGEEETVRPAVQASLALLDLAPDVISVPILGAVYRAPLGRLDAAIWLTGETGRNKTAYMGLAQAHYGAGWNREHLPDGWNSTANALERSAFTVKDAVFLIDDFKPAGNQREGAAAYAAVARILQGVADGQGRATLTADRKARAGFYPRGVVMSSSETLPRGHSNRARVVIVDVTRPLIGKDQAMSRAYHAAADQGAAGIYALAMAGYVRQIAGHFEAVRASGTAHRARIRALAPRFEGAHGRTGQAAAELAYGWEVFLSFALNIRAISQAEADALWTRVVSALEDTAQGQGVHLRDEDPVDRALSVLSGLLAQGRVYLEDRKCGGPPTTDPELYGWENVARMGIDGEKLSEWRTKPGAVRIGWHEKDGGDEWAYFLPDGLHEALQRAVGGQAGTNLPDASTLWGNMRDRFRPAGLMRCEAVRKDKLVTGWRPAFKATAHGMPGQPRLITLRLPLSLEMYDTGIDGINGIDGEERVSGRARASIPLSLFFEDKIGIDGMSSSASSTLTISVEQPSVHTLEELTEDASWVIGV